MPSGPGAPRDEQLVDSTSLWVAMGAKGDGANEDGSHLQLTRAAHLQLTRAAHLQIAESLWVPWEPYPMGWLAQGPMAPWGGIHSREARMGIFPPLFPRHVLPDGPPDARGPLEVLVGLLPIFRTFLGDF